MVFGSDQGTENRFRIEPRQTEPINAARSGNQRPGTKIGNETVFLDRSVHAPNSTTTEATTQLISRPQSGYDSGNSDCPQPASRPALSSLDFVGIE
jgi:hypothetical protein